MPIQKAKKKPQTYSKSKESTKKKTAKTKAEINEAETSKRGNAINKIKILVKKIDKLLFNEGEKRESTNMQK